MSGWAAAAQIAAQIGGDVLNAGLNAHEAKENRDFQEGMSNTAYVRAVRDMKNAGINPMLAAKVGGASTPGGSAASGADINVGRAVSSALSAQQASANVENTKQQTAIGQETERELRLKNDAFSTFLGGIEARTQSDLSSAGLAQKQATAVDQSIAESVARITNLGADTAAKRQGLSESVARIRSLNMSAAREEQAIQNLKVELAGKLTDNEAKALGLEFEKKYGEQDRRNRASFGGSQATLESMKIPKAYSSSKPWESGHGASDALGWIREFNNAIRGR